MTENVCKKMCATVHSEIVIVTIFAHVKSGFFLLANNQFDLGTFVLSIVAVDLLPKSYKISCICTHKTISFALIIAWHTISVFSIREH